MLEKGDVIPSLSLLSSCSFFKFELIPVTAISLFRTCDSSSLIVKIAIMKIRTITYGLYVEAKDFLINGLLEKKFDPIAALLDAMRIELATIDHEVQTVRVSVSSFENWLIPLMSNHNMSLETAIEMLFAQLRRVNITFCSVGNCSTQAGIELLPKVLEACPILHGSVLFSKTNETIIAPDFESCCRAAKVCLDLASSCGDLGNFRYCAAFNCKSGSPFFPVSFHEGLGSTVAIGFENGDVLLPNLEGVKSHEVGRSRLIESLKQQYAPIQSIAMSVCAKFGVEYIGIDASWNPSLCIEGSIGRGLEQIIYPTGQTRFGSMGTLAAVSTLTSAAKSLVAEGLKLVGYNGLMLPVMEDLRLAELAVQQPQPYSLRDLLLLSSVCGVGLDTIPIPGNTSVEDLAGVYMEVAALAFRLDKPLSCRLLPMQGKEAGDMTSVSSPYLCNTRVFSING